MITFENLDGLKDFLQRDKGTNSLNPARFINVNSLKDWFKMKNFLGTLTAKFYLLSDYCTGDDIFPNLRRLRKDLLQENRTVCILPLSELLRVNPDQAETEVKAFLNLCKGDTYSFRIYFLMYRLESFFLSLNVADQRKKDCILTSTADATDDYSLTIIQKNMPVKMTGERVDGFKRYLNYWEQTPKAALTLYTDNAVYLQDKNFFDDVKVIANAFELLRHHYNLPVEFKRNFGSDENWRCLAEVVSTAGSFERIDFEGSSFKNFNRLNDFQRWLLWLRCKLQGSSYAARCAKESASPEEFVERIYGLILNCADGKSFDELCRERHELLASMKIPPPESFLERVRQSDKHLALRVLTDNSLAEKILMFDVLKKFRFNESDAAQKILHRTFPALADYLSDALNGSNVLSDEQAEYFRRYRWLKVTDHLTESFYQRVNEIARNSGDNIYSLPTRNRIVNEEYSNATGILFVDGLGAEYLNFFAAKLSAASNLSVKYRVGRCNLPSVTELNKDFLQDRNVADEILEPDTLKHQNQPYPENILVELECLSSIKEKIFNALNRFKRIILCSDHGTSRLAVLARQSKFDKSFSVEGRKVYKSGRFADAMPGDDKLFPTAVECDGKIIFADYSRFLQKGSTGNEIHGGAALEEILVPIIVIEPRGKISTQPVRPPVKNKKIKRGIAANKDFDI